VVSPPADTHDSVGGGVHLVLYIRADSPRGQRARAGAEELLATLPGAELTVCDVRAEPQAAEAARVVATPTLIRVSPGPACRLVGDLSDLQLVRRLVLDGLSVDGHQPHREEQR
jgi:circadian clock protein KaiB